MDKQQTNELKVDSALIKRLSIEVHGIVQGVGFRPFVYNLAGKHGLNGFVTNTINGVYIEVEGENGSTDKFLSELTNYAPPLSEISDVKHSQIEPKEDTAFEIRKTPSELGNKTLISPDVSICDDCLNELFNESNRRYLYPFINCTNCGPRFTIIENIPYDRPKTTMKHFEMCDDCKAEYENPGDRRFHAQPNACPVCGPKVWLERVNNEIITNDNNSTFKKAAEYLSQGKILAVKGLGGFHLVVDAANEGAVKELRKRKNREAKPLAIMVKYKPALEHCTEFDESEYELLSSPQRPILLLKKIGNSGIADSVAPDNNRLGVMLPYTPLHYILFEFFHKLVPADSPPALVMTSANLSEEPIAIKNEEAKNRLSSIADAFLLHDREILIRADDSVGIIINKNERLIRRSRGYVPKPLLIENLKSDILAVGAELKNTVCLTSENKAFMSQHIGDLTNYTAYKFFEETISHLPRIMDVKPEYIVHDMYPDYLSRKWAKQQNFSKTFAVQHHHAHMGAVMAENGLDENVIGVMLDGTGYGYDGTIWGGEIFIGNYTALKRFAHLEPLKLPGGDTAVKEPWRIAYSYLYNAFDGVPPQLKLFEDYPIDTVRQMLDKNINSPVTSSMGRLFDAVSVLAGGPATIRYEAEAAIRLMHSVESLDFQPYRIKPITDSVIPVKNLIKQVYKDVIENKSIPEIAAKFHLTITDILIDAVTQAYHETGIKKIALSGGVFQNEVLLTLMENKLRKKNFEVYSHSKLPTNDGSISFGQAVIAGQLLNQNMEKVNYST